MREELFDKNYNLVDFAYSQVTSSGSPGYVSASYTVKEAGYAYVYISNESPTLVDVYFDDVAMTYTPGNVIQSNEYYPFGLQTAESWTRAGSQNNFLYNEGSELNATSGLYDLPFRNYDAALGRFFQVDPMATADHMTSPFAYGGNNPVNFNDPSGLMVDYSTSMSNPDYVYQMRMNAEGYERGMYNSQSMGRWSGWANAGPTGGWAGDAWGDAVLVRNGGMSMQEYVAKYGREVYNSRTSGYSLSGLNVSIAPGGRIRLGGWIDRESPEGNEIVAGGSIIAHGLRSVYVSLNGGGTQGGWFDDKQGEFFFDHWRNGKGQELFLNDAEWSAYMRSNSYLATVSIASHLYSLGIKDSQWIKGAFHGETGKSDWRSGHGMLNGSNETVGDLQYSGYAHVNSNGSISYALNFTWNDIMDPNSNYLGDTVGAILFPGTPYNVHVSWFDVITITPK